MKKLVVVTFACLLLSMSTTSFAEKVVVVPLGKAIFGGSSGIKVYDAEDQFLGLYLGRDYDYDTAEIFISFAKSTMSLRLKDGSIWLQDPSNEVFRYILPQCQGKPYVDDNPLLAGSFYEYPFSDSDYKYWSAPMFSATSLNLESYKYMETGVCHEVSPALPEMLVPVQLYTEEEIGFTLPINYPLRFETGVTPP